jgi:hypothetical protein
MLKCESNLLYNLSYLNTSIPHSCHQNGITYREQFLKHIFNISCYTSNKELFNSTFLSLNSTIGCNEILHSKLLNLCGIWSWTTHPGRKEEMSLTEDCVKRIVKEQPVKQTRSHVQTHIHTVSRDADHNSHVRRLNGNDGMKNGVNTLKINTQALSHQRPLHPAASFSFCWRAFRWGHRRPQRWH